MFKILFSHRKKRVPWEKTIKDVKGLNPKTTIYRASGSVMIKIDNFKKLVPSGNLKTTYGYKKWIEGGKKIEKWIGVWRNWLI